MTHPLLAAAAAGTLPDWAEASPARRAHMARVAELMEQWVAASGALPADVARWRAAGLLHDALRDAQPGRLRPMVDPGLRELPPGLLHGPAAAARLRREGVDDGELLLAIEFHTLGHADFGALGRALYLADYLEPGRAHESPARAALRARVTDDLHGVARAVARDRIGQLLDAGRPLHGATVGFWNGLVHG